MHVLFVYCICFIVNVKSLGYEQVYEIVEIGRIPCRLEGVSVFCFRIYMRVLKKYIHELDTTMNYKMLPHQEIWTNKITPIKVLCRPGGVSVPRLQLQTYNTNKNTINCNMKFYIIFIKYVGRANTHVSLFIKFIKKFLKNTFKYG